MKTARVAVVPFLLVLSGTLLAGETSMLTVGVKAPDFTLVSSQGDTVRLAQFAGSKHVVLIFYPGDETPGCTQQLCAIRDDYTQFGERDAVVFGVNPGSMDSHKDFVSKHGFQFPLLIDQGQVVAKEYGCGGWPMVKRTVYVVGKDGTIIFAKRGKPANSEILAAIPRKPAQ
jgi:peroxiredoxin Q/BCP